MGGDTTTAWRLCYCRQTGGESFLFPFVYRPSLHRAINFSPFASHHDQPELIGAEEIIFHLSSLLSLWITSCGRKNYTDQFQFLPLRQQNCNLPDFCIFLPVFLFCDKESRPTISTQVAASICYVECYLDILSRRSENSASLILCILKFLAILQNFMGALKIDGSKAKYIFLMILIKYTYW